MNLKANFHYTFFIYPFLVSSNKYNDFIGKFLSDGNWSFKIQDMSEKLNTYAYFLPYVKKFLFPTLYWGEGFKRHFSKLSDKKKTEIVSELTCTSFIYNIGNKENDSNQTGINCRITDIEMICFEPGICFLVIKSRLDKDGELCSDDILDFNYKFRTLNPKYLKKKKTEGLVLNNVEFHGAEDLSSFIGNLLNGFEDVEKENIYFDRLFTYSYMCLDQSEWNENRGLDEILNEFYKFQYILPSNYGSTFDQDFKGIKENTYTRWKYSIYGFSREAAVVFSSEREVFNSTKLPNYFEHIYFYIFLLAFYQRVSLILFSEELMSGGEKNIERLKDRLTKFTHFSWFSQITNSEQGMDMWKKWQKAFDLPQLFDEVQKEYSEYYGYTVARGQEKINLVLIIIYTISALFSGLTLLMGLKLIDTDNIYMKVFVTVLFFLSILIFPAYAIGKRLKRKLWNRNSRINRFK
ncbi:MAG: hypothetical protein Q8920_05960 [Bacillota bacterium]|nr:hypothetical protein [Bacillota bacterium]